MEIFTRRNEISSEELDTTLHRAPATEPRYLRWWSKKKRGSRSIGGYARRSRTARAAAGCEPGSPSRHVRAPPTAPNLPRIVRLRLGVTYEGAGNVTMSHRTREAPPNALRLSPTQL
ncbi:hypothetical protein EVAR_24360_1 [Eumeta japonica]|uniref:Uncharacterized protein n=1 Tax=Eumeta variegata TaxID=151549 RepID=A0A4C1YCS6_EUMVA|nr:hypothetical protein EVAR_24360_1 [Eumeta japonica]